jgi:mannose-6-phosphate isomerase-like protein (cupin superfamily)
MNEQRVNDIDAVNPGGDARTFAVVASMLKPRAAGPPLHVHPSLDVTYHVVEGNVTFRIGDVVLTALPGSSVRAPRWAPHTYANRGRDCARLLIEWTRGDDNGQIDESRIVGAPLAA